MQEKNDICSNYEAGIIFIDLRGYSKMVEEKPLYNIAKIIIKYQQCFTKTVKNIFPNRKVVFEYAGDGILTIISEKNNSINNLDIVISLDIDVYKKSLIIKDEMYKFIKLAKENYVGLDNLTHDEHPDIKGLDFGIGVSVGNICSTTMNDKKKRTMYFGDCINKTSKIGNDTHKNKNNIGFEKGYYDKLKKLSSFKEMHTLIETRTNGQKIKYYCFCKRNDNKQKSLIPSEMPKSKSEYESAC